jgi:hypothetical protein
MSIHSCAKGFEGALDAHGAVLRSDPRYDGHRWPRTQNAEAGDPVLTRVGRIDLEVPQDWTAVQSTPVRRPAMDSMDTTTKGCVIAHQSSAPRKTIER